MLLLSSSNNNKSKTIYISWSFAILFMTVLQCRKISAHEEDDDIINNNSSNIYSESNSKNENDQDQDAQQPEERNRGLYNKRFVIKNAARQFKNADHAINKRSLYNDILQQWEHFTESTTQFFSKFIPKPIRNLFDPFRGKSSRKDTLNEDINEVTDKSIDIFVADVINNIQKVTTSITKTIEDVGENIAKTAKTLIPGGGLDSNRTFFSGIQAELNSNKSIFSSIQAEFKRKVRAIYPGTLWCGDGNSARAFDDLGRFNRTDNCCRSHDYCTNNIESGQSKYGLSNVGLFTRSHCDCDIEFYECLKQANSIIALKIGFTYFTVLGPQCFKEEYPIVRCKRSQRGPLGANRCVSYEMEQNSTKQYQWFDAKFF